MTEHREIKFRAWDKWQKKMTQPCDGDFILWHSPSNYRNFLEVMQFTGLHDATKWEQLTSAEQDNWLRSGKTAKEWNGKEIYEGDILVDPSFPEKKYRVVWAERACGWRDQYGHKLPSFFGKPNSVSIGNIWENPELLKGKDGRPEIK